MKFQKRSEISQKRLRILVQRVKDSNQFKQWKRLQLKWANGRLESLKLSVELKAFQNSLSSRKRFLNSNVSTSCKVNWGGLNFTIAVSASGIGPK